MAYTMKRLEKAKKLFPPLPKDHAPSEELIKQAQGPRYNLRARREDQIKIKFPAWMDDDKDEDYIPEKKQRTSKK
ncbi:C6 finger domain protein [Penicillium malachiteum]|nr:C6 finger domain protein [Penicillium malachiteum]